MPARDVMSVCTELKDAGASPQDVCAAAQAHGLDRMGTIRILRELFGLTLADAKSVLDGPEGNVGPPRIESRDQLLEVLKRELGYCNCASGDALALLVRFLRAARRRSDSTHDEAEIARASREIEACLPVHHAAGLADWFVYGLEMRGFVEHNFRVTDVWITAKGRWLLEAIERTQPIED